MQHIRANESTTSTCQQKSCNCLSSFMVHYIKDTGGYLVREIDKEENNSVLSFPKQLKICDQREQWCYF